MAGTQTIDTCYNRVGHWESIPATSDNRLTRLEVEEPKSWLAAAGGSHANGSLGAGQLAVAGFIGLVYLAVVTKLQGQVVRVAEDVSRQQCVWAVTVVKSN